LSVHLRYNPAFDGLRALAVTLVVADHCHVPGFNPGYFGVDIFFVLSGFLITSLLVKEAESTGQIDFLRFYLRRFLRLGPPLFLLLAVYLAVAPVAWPQFEMSWHFTEAGLAAAYLSDYARAFWGMPRVLMHTWSLSVEEHFYLLWPAAILLVMRFDPKRRVAILFMLYLVATAWRVIEYDRIGWAATYFRFDTRMSGLIFGSMLAVWLPRTSEISEHTANVLGRVACVALLVCLTTGYWRAPWSLDWMTPLAEFASGALLCAAYAPRSWVRTALSVRPLVGLGIVSYGVYLWHYPIAVYFRDWLPWYTTVSIAAAGAIVVATLSYVMIERPLQRYRRNLGEARAASADQHAPMPGDAVPVRVPVCR
jgi:peptidoglycan/LPS O-acetylase OafA/YrhL